MVVKTVGTCGYAKKLGKYGFNPRLCASEVDCEEWLDFCKKNDMVWLKGSYGTLVHKNFNKYFIRLANCDESKKAGVDLGYVDDIGQILINLNHSNILKSTLNGIYMITSSPNYIDFRQIEKYPYKVYMIHPALLEDYAMDGKISLAFCNTKYDEISEINEAIYEDIGIYRAFRYIK